MQTAEIVIIGGGVVGASVAYHLTQRGCRDVLVLEREDALGRGSTGKATGGVRAQFETDINIQLSLYSLDFFRDWDVDCGYEPRGYVFLATNDTECDFLARTSGRQRQLGYDKVQMIDRDAIARMVPGLNCEDVVGGSFGPRDGFIDPLAVLEGFMSGAAAGGARIQTGQNVTEIETSSGRVTGVKTAAGQIECGSVVLCSGAWARQLASIADIDLPVEPMRRQIVWAKSLNVLPANMPMVIDLGTGFHFRSARGSVDEVLFASPEPDQKSGFSETFDESFIESAFGQARHRAPFLACATVMAEKCRAGLYEMTPDHHAILGTCEVERLYLANGFSGHGVMHSPATGRALSEIMLDGQSRFLDVTALHIDRFAKGELLHETSFI